MVQHETVGDESPATISRGSSKLKLRHLRGLRSFEKRDDIDLSLRDPRRSIENAKTDNGTPLNGSSEANPAEEIPTPPGPPDGGRVAWTQVFASFLINMNVYGFVNAFGEFQHFYETEYLPGYTSSTISWIGTVQGSLTLFVGALAGPIFDRGHFLLTLECASAGLVVSWMLLSVCTEYYQIMLTQGIMAGICVGLMEVPSIALIPDYFRKHIGLGIGLAVSGAPAGGLIYSAVFRGLLTTVGFGWATRVIGFIVLITLGICLLIIKPKDAVRKAEGRKFWDWGVFRETPFILTLFTAFFLFCAVLVPYFVAPSYGVALGTSSNTASYLLLLLNAAQFFGRVIPAWLSDTYGCGYMLLIFQVLMGAFGLHWITVATVGGYVEFLIFIGFITGAVSALGPTTIPFISPNPETLGMRIGVIYAAAGLGTLIGNPIALATAGDATIGSDATRGDFLGAQLWMGICGLFGAAFFVIPAKHAKKNQEAMWSSS